MRVTCPKCQCKGMLDTAPLLNKAHVTCVRCGAGYEALIVEGGVEITLLSVEADTKAITLAAEAHVELPEVAAEDSAQGEDSDQVLVLPQAYAQSESADEPVVVLDVASRYTSLPTEPAAAEEAHVHSPAVALGSDATHSSVSLADSGSFEMPKEYAPQFTRADVARAGENNNYSLGVRLMRVSPLWLLVCGLTFIGLIVLLNGLTGSAVQLDVATAARSNATGNHATNQSTNSTTIDRAARVQTSAATTPATKTERVPAVEQTNAAGAPQKIEQPAAPAQPVQTQPSPAAVKPTPAPVVEAHTDASGKFTLQVGSYNTPVEANERAAHLRAAGFTAQVVAVELPKRGTWYRVQTGRFADRAEAQRYGAQLRVQGAAESYIVVEVTAH